MRFVILVLFFVLPCLVIPACGASVVTTDRAIVWNGEHNSFFINSPERLVDITKKLIKGNDIKNNILPLVFSAYRQRNKEAVEFSMIEVDQKATIIVGIEMDVARNFSDDGVAVVIAHAVGVAIQQADFFKGCNDQWIGHRYALELVTKAGYDARAGTNEVCKVVKASQCDMLLGALSDMKI